ncbi:ABC transporter substrate-binding protein, partial [Pseudomonas syringae pv. tagetis]
YPRSSNPVFHQLIEQAPEPVNPQERAALYEQAQPIFNKDQPWISMAHTRMFKAMRKNVEGYQITPLTTNNLATTQVK